MSDGDGREIAIRPMNVEGGEETTVGHDEVLGHEEGEEDEAKGIKEEKYFEVERRGAKDQEREGPGS